MNDSTDTGAASRDRSETDAGPARLLEHPALWRAGQLIRAPEAVPTGFEVLDRHLPGHGWPVAGLCELMLPTAGLGELRLLLPALRVLSRQARWIAWVNPPFIPYAPALQAAGVDIDKILLIHPKSHQDALWALERATRSGTCSAALAWLDERELRTKDTRRLQLAARQGGTLSCLFRPMEALEESSMAELRLAIRAPVASAAEASAAEERWMPDGLEVSIRKRRGGWPIAGLSVLLDPGRRPAEIREQLSLWRKWRAADSAPAPERLDLFPGLHPRRESPDRHVTH